MNLAYPVEAPDNQAELMSFRGDFYENVKKIARAGYDGIELLVRDLDSIDTEAVKRCAVENHVKIAAISTAPMDKQDGLHLLGGKAKRELCVKRLQSAIRFAAGTGACVLLGKVRGNTGAESGTYEDLVERIRELADYARKYMVCLAVEPQHVSNINNINCVEEALSFLRQVGRENVLLHLDLYHMALSETDVLSAIERAKGKIGFVHVADTERKVPGEGDFALRAWIPRIAQIHPEVYFSPEIKQVPDSETVCVKNRLFFEKWNK